MEWAESSIWKIPSLIRSKIESIIKIITKTIITGSIKDIEEKLMIVYV